MRGVWFSIRLGFRGCLEMGNKLASFVINEVWSVCIVRWRFCSLRMGDNSAKFMFSGDCLMFCDLVFISSPTILQHKCVPISNAPLSFPLIVHLYCPG